MKLDYKKTFLLGFGFLGVSVVWTFYNSFVPIILKGFIASNALIGLIMTFDNILAVTIQPIIGAASDKTRTKIGRRMPYLLVGAPIAAANAGRVVLASNMYLTGYTVIIDHGLGTFSLYCHLSKLEVRRGVEVRKGDLIGKCGSTGRSTGPHLHWAVRVMDSRVDPYAMLLFPLPGAKRGTAPGPGTRAGRS